MYIHNVAMAMVVLEYHSNCSPGSHKMKAPRLRQYHCRTGGNSYPLGDIHNFPGNALWLMKYEDITVYAGTVSVSTTRRLFVTNIVTYVQTYSLAIEHARALLRSIARCARAPLRMSVSSLYCSKVGMRL